MKIIYTNHAIKRMCERGIPKDFQRIIPCEKKNIIEENVPAKDGKYIIHCDNFTRKMIGKLNKEKETFTVLTVI